MPVLNWIGKEAVVKHHKDVPFRLIEPVEELSCSPPYEGGVDAVSADGVVLSSEASPLDVRKSSAFPGDVLNDRRGSAADLSGGIAAESSDTADGEAFGSDTQNVPVLQKTQPRRTSSGTAAGAENHPVGEAPTPLLRKEGSQNENLIIEGDNLHALKALLPRYAGKVKCIYIDPPYNTGNEGWAYNDNVKSPEILKWLGEVVGKEGETLDRHDRWLCMMYPRLLLLKQFLREDGSIWISMDENEVANLRLLMDEVFGRHRFVAVNAWQKRYSRENRGSIGDVHEYIMVYAMNPAIFQETRHRVPIDEKQAAVYKNPNNDPKGRWRGIPMTAQGWRPNQMYEIVTPSGKTVKPPEGRCWSTVESEFLRLKAEGRIYFGKNGDSQPSTIRYLSEVEGFIPWTWWPHEEVGHTDESRKEIIDILETQTAFDTPKPTRLLRRILQIATDKDSLILDSFAGSGTTGHAVLKQNAEDGGKRRFILVEMDPKIAKDVTAERVRRVAEGYTKANGDAVAGLGGGFQYCRLSAEPLFDAGGSIRKDVTFAQLAEFVWFMETGAGRGPSEALPLDVRKSSAFPGSEPIDSGGSAADLSSGIAAEKVATLGEAELRRTSSGTAARDGSFGSLLLGVLNGKAVFLLYNGILKDRSDIGGNVLNGRTLEYVNGIVPEGFEGECVVYGARSRFDKKKLASLGITFHQLPYDLATKTWF